MNYSPIELAMSKDNVEQALTEWAQRMSLVRKGEKISTELSDTMPVKIVLADDIRVEELQ